MGILSCASASSCWRGLDYFTKQKVSKLDKINDYEFTSIVHGTEDYNVYLNLDKTRKSTCNCPKAYGKRVICKHIVATYFKAVPGSAEEFEKEQEKLQEEYEEYEEKEYEKVVDYLNHMTKAQLISELEYIFNYAPDWVYDDFVRSHRIGWD